MSNAAFKPWQDKSWLYERYIMRRMTCEKMVEELKLLGHSVTLMTVYNNLKKHDLIKNSRNLGKRTVGGNSKNKGGYYS